MNSKIALALLIFSVLALLPSAASAGVVTCHGLPVTIFGTPVDDNPLFGTVGEDVIFGDAGNDTIYGLGGNDTICGGDGHDTLIDGDGSGNDWMAGGDGDDTYAFGAIVFPSPTQIDILSELPGEGVDTLDFNTYISSPYDDVQVNLAGDAYLGDPLIIAECCRREVKIAIPGEAANFENAKGGPGDDNIRGNAVNNVLEGFSGTDTLLGGEGSDLLLGGDGWDDLQGDTGDDYLTGGNGNDDYIFLTAASPEIDTVTELSGQGLDGLLFYLSSGDNLTVDLNSITIVVASHINRTINTFDTGQAVYFEKAEGGAGNDNIMGNNSDNDLKGGDGEDSLNGSAGNDQLSGGRGNDNLVGGEGDDLLRGDWGDDNIDGGAGGDVLEDTDGNNHMEGGEGNDVLVASLGEDYLSGGPGDDTLRGGFGNDDLYGGIGNDTYEFDATNAAQSDTVGELPGEGIDKLDFIYVVRAGVAVDLSSANVIATGTYLTVSTAETGQAANFEDVRGSWGDDTIIGNAADNSLYGLGGINHLIGGDGDDFLDGGNNNDTLEGSTGDDILWDEYGSDYFYGGPGDDLLVGEDGDDILAGGPGDDNYLFLSTSSSQTDTVIELAGEGTHDLLNFDLAPSDPVMVNLNNDFPIATHANRTVNTAAAGQAANFEDVWNGAGNDNITGNAANNILWDWEGSDFMAGGLGDDVYYFFPAFAPQTERVKELGSAGNDWLFFSALVGASITQVSAMGVDPSRLRSREIVSPFLGEGGEGKEFGVLQVADAVHVDLRVDNPIAYHTNRTVRTGASGQAKYFENVVGGAGNDLIIGNRRPNILAGGGGNDNLKGLRGSDLLPGEDGDDTLIGGRDTDTGDGGPGVDICRVEIKYNCP